MIILRPPKARRARRSLFLGVLGGLGGETWVTALVSASAVGVMALGACSPFSVTLLAHHSGAMFEKQKTITVEGVVKEFQYTNPHSWLLVDVKNRDGTVTTWGFEAEGPSTLHRAGIRPSDLAPGTKLKITGRPMKDGSAAAAWVDAVRADGKRFDPSVGFKVK